MHSHIISPRLKMLEMLSPHHIPSGKELRNNFPWQGVEKPGFSG
jgi:hypothetical protein